MMFWEEKELKESKFGVSPQLTYFQNVTQLVIPRSSHPVFSQVWLSEVRTARDIQIGLKNLLKERDKWCEAALKGKKIKAVW
jgi:hypothetical protein